MNPSAYDHMGNVEAKHWWFVGRRAILRQLIDDINIPSDAKILEVGCGTGGNLEMLLEYGEVFAFEYDSSAREMAISRNGHKAKIEMGACPNAIPFHEELFDLICIFDVLEHIEKDIETIFELRKRLKKNGKILITVPAYQWLYGSHDVYLHHIRRYSKSNLKIVANDGGCSIIKIGYFNTLLFPLALFKRLKDKIIKPDQGAGIENIPKYFNAILSNIFGFERHLINRVSLPAGVSLFCLLKNKE